MKKYKMMALTGILLSSTILGANTSVVQAASANTDPAKAINVDKSSLNNIIQVINDLLGSSSTANKVNAQTKFSDLVAGNTYNVAPIFGEQSASTFATALQSELNVVDGSGQLVPMTVVKSDDHGFATEVRYTLDGVTKNINVGYNLTQPTVSFKNGQILNYNAADGLDTINSDISSNVSATTKNGNDANGNVNKASLSSNPSSLQSIDPQTSITFTPSDIYSDIYGSGIQAKAIVNTYAIPTTVPDRTAAPKVGDSYAFVDQSSGQRYLATLTKLTDPVSPATYSVANYNITAIDSMGNTINDSKNNSPISGTATGKITAPSDTTGTVNYTLVLRDAITKKTVLTQDESSATPGTVNKDTTALKDALNNSNGYVLSNDNQSQELTADTQELTFDVTKNADTTINYISTSIGKSVGTENLKGNNGTVTALAVPTGFKLENLTDIAQKLNADQKTKDVYVTPINDSIKNLSYTVTFRDKDTGKVVGSQVNSEGALGDYIGLTAPDGYAFASILDNGFVLLKNDQQVTKYVKAANTPYNISYVDQDTNKEVGTQSGKGADGSKVTLKAPTDYAFVNADDMTYTIDKDDTATKTIYVQKSNQTVDNIVSGYPKNGYIKIYDASGKLNKDVVLSEGSSWIIDRTVTINGAEYYRVATNEYVKASDVYTYTPLQSIVTTKGVNVTPVYNSRGQLVIDLALDTNTPWYTDRSATIKGSKMYRVATDQWVKASDVTLK